MMSSATRHVILFVAANPSGTNRLALDREARSIHCELKRSGYRDRFDFVTRWAVEPLDLLRELRELRPTVVHFTGHGRTGVAGQPGSADGRDVADPIAPAGGGADGLYFHDSAGDAQLVSPEAIAEALRAAGTSVKLVVLNACYSTSFAGALLAHVDCVVGMSGSIHDDAARCFAIGFYGGLGEHESIAMALEQGRAAINLEGLPDSERPQLKMRAGFDPKQFILAAVAPLRRLELQCPYPGMRAYAADDAAGFHGRDAEISELLGRLRAGEREIYVVGPSGSGKSSLVAAGVLPRLARGAAGLGPFVVRDLRPGEQPATRLSRALEAPRGKRLVVSDCITALLAHRDRQASVLLLVDQLEELFTQASNIERTRFLATLRDLREERRCVVIFILRADFFGALMESDLWTVRGGRLSRIEVSPLRGTVLRDAISEPAAAMGVVVEAALTERLLADAASEPGILPLLQETMVQLWDERADQTLTLADYQKLGDKDRSGLAVALSRRADKALRELTAIQELIARRILLRLVSFGEGRSDTRRQQLCSRLRVANEDIQDFEYVLQHLVAERLVTIDHENEGDRSSVDLAHEILISAWPTLANWIQRYRAYEYQRRQLETAAARWLAHERSGRGLLNPIELAEAKAWRRTESAREMGEDPAVTELIAASAKARRRQLWRRRGLICGAFVALLALATSARRQAHDNECLLARSYTEAGRQLVVEGHPQEAIPYLVAARRHGEAGVPLRTLFWSASRVLPVLLEHAATVRSAEFTSDGTRIVTVSDDNRVQVWDAATGRPLTLPRAYGLSRVLPVVSSDGMRVVAASGDTTMRIWSTMTGESLTGPLAHARPVSDALFSGDGLRVVTISDKGFVQVWDAISGEPLTQPLAHQVSVQSARFSPDGTRIVTVASDNTARVWDVDSGDLIIEFPNHDDRILSAEFSSDGRFVVTASADNTAQIWSAATAKPTTGKRVHAQSLRQYDMRRAVFSVDGTRILTMSGDATVQLWNAADGSHLVHALLHPGLMTATFSPNDSLVLTAGSDHTARIWDARTGEPLGGPLWHEGAVSKAAFSPDGMHVVTVSDDRTARIWQVPRLVSFIAHQDEVLSAAFSADGKRMVTASIDQTARVWDAATGKPVAASLQHGGVVWSAAFSPDGTRVVTASADETARIWDAANGTLLATLVHDGMVKNAIFSPDGTRVATASERGAWVWNAITGALVIRHNELDYEKSAKDQVWSVAFSPDGTHVVSASAHVPVVVWDAVSGENLTRFHQHDADVTSARFSPDGTLVLTASFDKTARIWNAATGRQVVAPLEHEDVVWDAVFSSDGKRVLTASKDKTASIWDVATGQMITRMLAYEELRSAAFSPDGERVLTVGQDNTARIWDATTGRPLTAPLERRLVRMALFSPDGTHLIMASIAHTVSILDTRFDPGTVEEWSYVAGQDPFVLSESAQAFLNLRSHRQRRDRQ